MPAGSLRCDVRWGERFFADLTKPAEISQLMSQAAAFAPHKTVDILINNAGIQHVAPVVDMPIDVCSSPSNSKIITTYDGRNGTSSSRSI